VALTLCGETADYLDRYKGNVAINVKYRGDPKLSEETLAALKKLDGATRDNILRFAEEALRDSWWASMQERSKELGLGELWADGRSGGWLVFKMATSKLEERIYEAEKSCAHCKHPFDVHVDTKCPFDSTHFAAGEAILELWSAFKQFSVEVHESMQHVGDDLESEIQFQLENLDDDNAVGLPPRGGSEANPAAFQEGEEEDGNADDGVGIP
jgi:hypothetical protein